jgi:hypothetical protein
MSDNIPDRQLEATLRCLKPSAGVFDRDQLFFRAGQCQPPRRWLWPATSAALALVAGVLGTLLALQPEPQTIEHIVYVNVPAPTADVTPDKSEASLPPATEATPAGPSDYLRLREQVLRWGVDALPPTSFPTTHVPARPMTVLDGLQRAKDPV